MAYLTSTEILDYKLGVDYSMLGTPTLEVFIDLASDIINEYLGRDYSLEGDTVEEGFAISDNQGRIYFKLKNKPVNHINYFKLKSIGGPEIDIDVTKIDLFKEPGFGYIYNNTFLSNGGVSRTQSIFSSQSNFKCEVGYNVTSNPPKAIKMACAMLVTNISKAGINSNSTGVQGASGDITSFTSGNYQVNFKNKEMTYQGGIESKRGYLQSNYMTPEILSLLYPYKAIGQNII